MLSSDVPLLIMSSSHRSLHTITNSSQRKIQDVLLLNVKLWCVTSHNYQLLNATPQIQEKEIFTKSHNLYLKELDGTSGRYKSACVMHWLWHATPHTNQFWSSRWYFFFTFPLPLFWLSATNINMETKTVTHICPITVNDTASRHWHVVSYFLTHI